MKQKLVKANFSPFKECLNTVLRYDWYADSQKDGLLNNKAHDSANAHIFQFKYFDNEWHTKNTTIIAYLHLYQPLFGILHVFTFCIFLICIL